MNQIICVFNNVKGKNDRLKSLWGLAFLVKTQNIAILFDTGSNGDELYSNLEKLNINIREIQKIVISHNHRDHKGGLDRLLSENTKRIDLYYPESSETLDNNIYTKSKNVFFIRKTEKINDCVHIAGLFGYLIKEQCLVINSDNGLILLIGCAHPGIVNMARKIKKYFNRNIYAIFGGLHLEYCPSFIIKIITAQLKNIGVIKIGPSHCTGEKAISLFKDVYKSDFIEMNLGDKFLF